MPEAGHPTGRRIAAEVEKFSHPPSIVFSPFPLAPPKYTQPHLGARIHPPPAGTGNVPAHAPGFRMPPETVANLFKVRRLGYRIVVQKRDNVAVRSRNPIVALSGEAPILRRNLKITHSISATR